MVESLAARHRLVWRRAPARIRAEIAEGTLDGAGTILALPRTFMNESGSAVGPLLRYFRVPTGELAVVHDDIDLGFGRLRFHFGRGTGGHLGVDSVTRAIGTLDFYRLRVGIGRPPLDADPAVFVLRPFARSELPEVEIMVDRAVSVLEAFSTEGREAAIRRAADRPAE